MFRIWWVLYFDAICLKRRAKKKRRQRPRAKLYSGTVFGAITVNVWKFGVLDFFSFVSVAFKAIGLANKSNQKGHLTGHTSIARARKTPHTNATSSSILDVQFMWNISCSDPKYRQSGQVFFASFFPPLESLPSHSTNFALASCFCRESVDSCCAIQV